jgi:hypothetical protein
VAGVAAIATVTLVMWHGSVPAQETVSPAWADVRAFGAVGDGTRDDTEAFRRAIATGLPVLIPQSKAQFLIKETLVVGSGQAVAGVSRGQSVVKCAASGACFTSDPNASKKTRDITFRDFSIIGNRNPATIGIALVRSTEPTIQNIHIEDIGGIGIVIDGSARDKISQAHYAYIANVHIVGAHRIGVQMRGPGTDEGTNRHRVFFLRVNGSSEVALDIGPRSGTSNYFGFSAENVHTAVRIAGRHNYFYGLQIETARGHGIEFVKGSGNNRFTGTTMSKVNGSRWANAEHNIVRGEAATKDPDFAK